MEHKPLLENQVKNLEQLFVNGVGGSAVIEQGSHKELGAVLAVYTLQNGLFGYKGSGWGLLLEVPLEKALVPVNLLARNTAALAIIVAILLMGVLYYAGKMLARPVEKLTETVEEVSRGNLTVMAEISTKDEVGELARSFNRMTDALQRTTVSKNYLDNILKTMLSTLIVINPDTNIVSVNRSALRLLGYQEKELLGQPIDSIIADPAIFQEKNLDPFIQKGAVANVETSYLSKDGRAIPMLFSCSAMYDAQGNIQSIVCAAADISKRKKHEEKLRCTSRALRALPCSFAPDQAMRIRSGRVRL